MSRQLLELGQLEQAAERRALLRHGRRPLAPRVQDLDRPLDRPEERARVDLRQRIERELERRDGAEVPAAAAERPEQIGLALGIRADEPPVG